MSNRVAITFEFDGLPDGSDEDLLSDALSDLEQIVERAGFQSSTLLSLEVETNGVGGPDGTHYSATQASVRVEISR
jgi:hypothetical protein